MEKYKKSDSGLKELIEKIRELSNLPGEGDPFKEGAKEYDNDVLSRPGKWIQKWQDKLGISDWNITTERIKPEQVVYNGATEFIGVCFDQEDLCAKEATIYHDTDLYEEAIIHELLHIRYPTKSEYWVNKKTEKLLRNDR